MIKNRKLILLVLVIVFVFIVGALSYVSYEMDQQNNVVKKCLDVNKIDHYSSSIKYCNVAPYQNYSYYQLNDNCINRPNVGGYKPNNEKHCHHYCSDKYHYSKTCIDEKCINYVTVNITDNRSVKEVKFNQCFNYTRRDITQKCNGFNCDQGSLKLYVLILLIFVIIVCVLISLIHYYTARILKKFKRDRSYHRLVRNTSLHRPYDF